MNSATQLHAQDLFSGSEILCLTLKFPKSQFQALLHLNQSLFLLFSWKLVILIMDGKKTELSFLISESATASSKEPREGSKDLGFLELGGPSRPRIRRRSLLVQPLSPKVIQRDSQGIAAGAKNG